MCLKSSIPQSLTCCAQSTNLSLVLYKFTPKWWDCFWILLLRGMICSLHCFYSFQHILWWCAASGLCKLGKSPECWYKQTRCLGVYMKTLTKRFCLEKTSPVIQLFLLSVGQQATVTLHSGPERWVVHMMWRPAKDEGWKVIILNETFCCDSIHHTLWTLDSASERSNPTWLHYCDWLILNHLVKEFRKQPFLPSNSISASLKWCYIACLAQLTE